MKKQWRKPILIYKFADMPFMEIINYEELAIRFSPIPRVMTQEEKEKLAKILECPLKNFDNPDSMEVYLALKKAGPQIDWSVHYILLDMFRILAKHNWSKYVESQGCRLEGNRYVKVVKEMLEKEEQNV